MWKHLFVLGVLLMCSGQLIKAQEDFKTITGVFGIFPTVDAKNPLQGLFSLPVSENVLSIKSALIRMTMDTNFFLDSKVNFSIDGQSCFPDSVVTPMMQFRYDINFDCRNVIMNGGEHKFQFDSGEAQTNLLGEYVLTYTTEATPDLRLSGTDYSPFDIGKIHLQLLQGNNYLNNRSCKTDAFYPNGSFFLKHIPMLNIADSQGVYYFDFIVPPIVGVYPVTAECRVPVESENIFATQFTLGNGTDTSGSYLDTFILDGSTHDMQETGINPRTYSSFYNLTPNTAINLSELQEIDVTIFYSLHESGAVSTASTENFQLNLKNYSSGSCVFLSNITGRAVVNAGVLSASISTGNLSTFFSPNSQILTVCFEDTNKADTTRDRFNLDLLYGTVITSTFVPVDTVRGSNEINVMSWVTPFFGNITALGNITSACFVNETSIASTIWGYGNYTGNRTLTDYNMSGINEVIGAINFTPNIFVSFNGTVNVTNIVSINATFNVTTNFTLADFTQSFNSTLFGFWNGACPQFKVGKCVYDYFFKAGAVL